VSERRVICRRDRPIILDIRTTNPVIIARLGRQQAIALATLYYTWSQQPYEELVGQIFCLLTVCGLTIVPTIRRRRERVIHHRIKDPAPGRRGAGGTALPTWRYCDDFRPITMPIFRKCLSSRLGGLFRRAPGTVPRRGAPPRIKMAW